ANMFAFWATSRTTSSSGCQDVCAPTSTREWRRAKARPPAQRMPERRAYPVSRIRKLRPMRTTPPATTKGGGSCWRRPPPGLGSPVDVCMDERVVGQRAPLEERVHGFAEHVRVIRVRDPPVELGPVGTQVLLASPVVGPRRERLDQP